jgi:nitroreductase
MEVGHVAQNLSLTAVALGLGTVSIGAFSDDEVKRVLGIPWEPLLIMPVGHPAEP